MIKYKIAAGIVTYDPELDRLKDNILSIVNQVDMVIINDNHSINISDIRALCRDYEKVKLLENKKNVGVAMALNNICREAIKEKYDWILTLDQDSICPSDLISQLLQFADQQTGIVAPSILYRDNERFYKKQINSCEKVKWVITSASLTNLRAWKDIDGFDDILFIDKVDYDFFMRLNNSGYSVKKVKNVVLLHELGNLKCKKILWKLIYITNHSPIRYYYMCRNTIYLRYKLGIGNCYSYILSRLIKILVFEKNKGSKLLSIIKGVNDGIKMSSKV